MRVRALDGSGDWQYGKGQNDYRRNQNAVAQNIQTRLSSFLADCFFDLGAGIDWFGYLGSKNQIGLNLAINAVILNTAFVTGIVQTSLNLTEARNFQVSYTVTTSYGQVTSTAEITTSVA